jgi:hypothetical protein
MLREAGDQICDMLGDAGTSGPLAWNVRKIHVKKRPVPGDRFDLLSRGDLTSQKKPEGSLGKGLAATLSLGKELRNVRVLSWNTHRDYKPC